MDGLKKFSIKWTLTSSFLVLSCLLYFLPAESVQSRDNPVVDQLAGFVISFNVNTDDNKIQLTCENDTGCAWRALRFVCPAGKCNQDINKLGMIRTSEEENQSESFRINIQRSESQVLLSCSSGCAWNTLNFRITPGRPQAVDPYGMTSLPD